MTNPILGLSVRDYMILIVTLIIASVIVFLIWRRKSNDKRKTARIQVQEKIKKEKSLTSSKNGKPKSDFKTLVSVVSKDISDIKSKIWKKVGMKKAIDEANRGSPKSQKNAAPLDYQTIIAGNKSGYLKKLGTSSKWNKYWFVLRKDVLYYYKEKTDSKPRGAFIVSNCNVDIAVTYLSRQNTFHLELTESTSGKGFFIFDQADPNRKIDHVHLEAQDVGDMVSWINALVEFANAKRVEPTLPPTSEMVAKGLDISSPTLATEPNPINAKKKPNVNETEFNRPKK